MKAFRTIDVVTIALIAAILCILSPMSIPLGFTPIPLTLGLFAVTMAGIILGPWKGMLCVLVYILLGAVGLPVFSGYTGGLPKIAGPTGGYLLGYLFLGWITGFFLEKFTGKWHLCLIGAVIGVLVCDGFGTVWMGVQLSMGPVEALWAGMIPFLPFDLAKVVFAVLACYPVRNILVRQHLISR